jgi:hypothetical protein
MEHPLHPCLRTKARAVLRRHPRTAWSQDHATQDNGSRGEIQVETMIDPEGVSQWLAPRERRGADSASLKATNAPSTAVQATTARTT